MIWISSRVRPSLARRTVSTSSVSPGRKRSWPIRSSGPLGTSRMPVASTTRTPGRPRAKRSYQARISGVTNPSSLARQGTIAGTQVRSRTSIGPMSIGLNRRLAAASSRVGQRASRSGCLIRSGGFHMPTILTTKARLDGVGRSGTMALAGAGSASRGGRSSSQPRSPAWPRTPQAKCRAIAT